MTSTTSTSSSGLTSISGLASGIDTSSLISSLMAVAAGTQNLLKTRLATSTTRVTALQGLNTQGVSLKNAASALAGSSAWLSTTATSSDTSVTATTSGLPASGSLSFDVTQLAAAHSVVTGAITDPGDGSTPSFTLTSSSGTSTSITASSWNAASIASAINNGDSDVSATTVHSSDGDRVLITSKATGASSTFTLTNTSTASGGTSANSALTSSVVTTGADATISLGGGTTLTSSSNTFTNLMSGVNATVSKVASGVTLTVGKDTAGITTQVAGLISSLDTMLSTIATKTKADVSSSGGTTTNNSGPLVGDYAVQSVGQNFLSAMAQSVGSDTASTAGISVNSDGTVDFDQDTFTQLLASDPAKAQSLVQTLSSRIQSIATTASDPYSGSISREIASDQSDQSDLTDQISDWDTRLAVRKQTLTDQFTAMETALSTLSSQGTALTQMIASLSS